jgi:Baculovirus FP protein
MKEMKDNFYDVSQKYAELSSENIKMKNNMSQMYKDLDFLHEKINRMEQFHLLNDVEIVGVPETQDEDLGDILQKLFDHAECSPTIGAVKNVYRKKKTKNGLPGTIIATFVNNSNKTEFITATKKKKLSSSFLSSENQRPVYVNEKLTKHNKYLFYLARDLRRTKLVKYAWTDHGQIMVKTDDNTDSIIINNASTIERIRDQIHQTN